MYIMYILHVYMVHSTKYIIFYINFSFFTIDSTNFPARFCCCSCFGVDSPYWFGSPRFLYINIFFLLLSCYPSLSPSPSPSLWMLPIQKYITNFPNVFLISPLTKSSYFRFFPPSSFGTVWHAEFYTMKINRRTWHFRWKYDMLNQCMGRINVNAACAISFIS